LIRVELLATFPKELARQVIQFLAQQLVLQLEAGHLLFALG